VTKIARIVDHIMRHVESGALQQGDRLPSEAELAMAHNVSVGTAQKALTRLVHSGLIKREQGRGTFVSGPPVAPAEVRYLRFRDSEGNELQPYVHLRSVRRMKRKGPWSEFLETEATVRIERLINIGGRFDLYSDFWLREDDFLRLGGVERAALEKNLRELVNKRLALPTVRVDQWIQFDRLPPAAARELELEPEQRGLVMVLRGYSLRDRPLYYQSICAGPFSERLVIMRENGL
jgi:DNA-binding GntR family transcriptional regulator